MKVNIGFKNKSANGIIGFNLDNIVEIKPLDNCIAFMREYEDKFKNICRRAEGVVPYDNIAYIFCEPDEEEGE